MGNEKLVSKTSKTVGVVREGLFFARQSERTNNSKANVTEASLQTIV